MKVLVACEESQRVCIAFRDKGHEAYSCDLQECSGGHPEWHIRGDAIDALYSRKWDLVIAHPPCTYLSNAGARWLYAGKQLNMARYSKGRLGKEFFMIFYDYDGRIAIENPMPSSIYGIPKPSQIIQPYQFGEPWSKKTYLWLKGVTPLIPTEIIDTADVKPYCPSGSYSGKHDPRYKGHSRCGKSAKVRSRTFEGIARAMAEQWG